MPFSFLPLEVGFTFQGSKMEVTKIIPIFISCENHGEYIHPAKTFFNPIRTHSECKRVNRLLHISDWLHICPVIWMTG